MALEDEELFVAPEADDTGHQAEAPEHDDPDDDLEITIEGEEAPKPGADSDLVRKLRAEIKERDQRLKGYEQPKPVTVGPKPKLEDFEYDEAKYDDALLAWNTESAKAKDAEKAEQTQRETANRSWQQDLQAFENGKSDLGVKDFDASEEAVVSTMSQVQQAVIVKAASTPQAAAKIVYALGKHPDRLKALAAIEDPIKLAVAIAKLEGQITVNTRGRAPEPDSKVRGSASLARGEDKVLAKLEAEADRTGDRTKVVQHKRKMREQAAKK